MDASNFKSTFVFPHLAENLWPWTVDPPFVDASLFWVLPHIAQAIPTMSTVTSVCIVLLLYIPLPAL